MDNVQGKRQTVEVRMRWVAGALVSESIALASPPASPFPKRDVCSRQREGWMDDLHSRCRRADKMLLSKRMAWVTITKTQRGFQHHS